MSSPTSKLNYARDKIVRAGAGAGKTTDLVENILQVIKVYHQEYGNYPQMVVTTFTRKATQELRERLVLKTLELADDKLLKAVTSPSTVSISTIHGVLRQFLSRFGSHIGLVPNFRVISDSEDLLDRKRIMKNILIGQFRFQRFLQEETSAQILQLLDRYYSNKLENPQLRAMIGDDFKLQRSLSIKEFSQKLEEHADLILQETDNAKWIKYAETLQQLAKTQGDELDKVERLRDFRANQSKPRNVGKIKPVSEEFAKLSSEFWSEFKEWAALPDWDDEFLNELAKRNSDFEAFGDAFVEEYIHFKMNKAVLRQADLELLSLELIRRHPNVATDFALDWNHWFVDEFQDTSPVQLLLIEQLTANTPVYIVGDPQQSIYLFRGARSEVFAGKWEEAAPEKRNIKMKNYRSRPELMNFLNKLVTGISDQFQPMELKGELVDTDHVAQFAAVDSVEEELLQLGKNITGLIKSGVEPSEIAVLTRKRLHIRWICKHLSELSVPFQTFVPAGYFDRLEVIDSLNILKFICQPHDDETVVGLLRSPWFNISDSVIAEYCSSKKGSLWTHLLASKAYDTNEAVKRMRELTVSADANGVGGTWQAALEDCGILDTCSHHDLSGRREANLWKLICDLRRLECQPGFRYLDYVNQTLSDFSDDEVEEGDAVAAFEANRVNIMTAHKSKGLQFSHVILPFCGERPGFSSVEDFTRDESTGQFSLPLLGEKAGKNIRLRPMIAKHCRLKMNARELEENQRVLYVGLTRAKHKIYLSWSKVAKSSWAELVSPHIATLQNFGLEYVEGFEKGPDEVIDVKADISDGPRPLWAQESVSKAGKAVTEIDEKPVYGISVEQIERRESGTRLHRVLESLKTYPVDELIERSQGNEKEALEYIKDLASVPILQIIEQGHVEWGFSLRSPELNVDGQIDLWGIVDGICYIVDYKTGAAKYRETAFNQLKYYAQCLRKGSVEQPIRLVALYPTHKQCFVEDFEHKSDAVGDTDTESSTEM